jgi:hypothetical protein
MRWLGPLLIILSIPLLFRWVPRNGLYGFRVPATLRSDAVWYEVNARSARHFILLGALLVALDFAIPLSLRDAILGSIAVAGLVVVTVVNWRYANRLSRETRV